VEGLSFIKSATWRLSIAVLARLQADRARLVQAVTEGMRLQVMALGPFLVGFGWAARWLLPSFFGNRWLPLLDVYPFIALSYLTNAVFNLHSSVLYVLKRNWEVAVFHLVHIVLLAGGTFILVPRLGLVGYGWAEVMALLSYGVIHAYTLRYIGAPKYQLAIVWWAGMVLPLFWRKLGVWSALGLALVLLWPGARRELRRYVRGWFRNSHRSLIACTENEIELDFCHYDSSHRAS